MPVVIQPGDMPVRHSPGWSETRLADAGLLGAPLPMVARRFQVDPGAEGPAVAVGANEAMLYVRAGTGTGEVEGGGELELAPETMVWLSAGEELVLRAGPGGLDVLFAQAPGT